MIPVIYHFLEEDDWEFYPHWGVAQKYRHVECELFYKEGLRQFKKNWCTIPMCSRRMYAAHCICKAYQLFRYWNKFNLIHEGRFL